MDFNDGDVPERLSVTVTLGWEHSVLTDESGEQIVYKLDDDGQRVPRRYIIPVRLSAAQVIERTRGVGPETVAGLSRGELGSLVDILDALVGEGIVERVGTDPTVPTEAFVRFLNWLVDELQLTRVLGGDSGN